MMADKPSVFAPAEQHAFVGRKTRLRRRDGREVPKSHPAYHAYKISKRNLRKSLACGTGGVAEDAIAWEGVAMADWCGVRQYQCSVLADMLKDANLADQELVDCVKYEIECVLEWLLKKKGPMKTLKHGAAAQWVAMSAQQHQALRNGAWQFLDDEDVQKWTLENLWDIFKRGGFRVDSDTNNVKHLSVQDLAFFGKDEAKSFQVLLKFASPPLAPNPIRAARASSESWLYKGIVDRDPAACVDQLTYDLHESASRANVVDAADDDEFEAHSGASA